MKQLSRYIQEKLHISNYKKDVYLNCKIGDVIKDYNLNGKNYNLVCCISKDQIDNDNPIFIIDDKKFEYSWLTNKNEKEEEFDIKDVENGEEDTNGKENTDIIINWYNKNLDKSYKCAALKVRNKYGDKAYLPSIKELNILYKNLNKINSNLKNKIPTSGGIWSSTQYNSNNTYILSIHFGNLYNHKKNSKFMICPFIQL